MSHHQTANSKRRTEQRLVNRQRAVEGVLDDARALVDQANATLETSLAMSAAAGEGMLPGSGNT